MSTGSLRRSCVASLLSFQGPRAEDLRAQLRWSLKTAQRPNGYSRRLARSRAEAVLTVKILRAHGGCLGTRSRRRTWTAAISRGEALNSL